MSPWACRSLSRFAPRLPPLRLLDFVGEQHHAALWRPASGPLHSTPTRNHGSALKHRVGFRGRPRHVARRYAHICAAPDGLLCGRHDIRRRRAHQILCDVAVDAHHVRTFRRHGPPDVGTGRHGARLESGGKMRQQGGLAAARRPLYEYCLGARWPGGEVLPGLQHFCDLWVPSDEYTRIRACAFFPRVPRANCEGRPCGPWHHPSGRPALRPIIQWGRHGACRGHGRCAKPRSLMASGTCGSSTSRNRP